MEEKKIYKAIPAIMAEIGAIGKTKQNKQQGFLFRGIDQVMNTMKPLLAKHGVFVVPEVVETKREERAAKSGGNIIYTMHKINYHFVADDGSEVVATVSGEGMDSADKSSNKAMAVAFKYACFQVFCIPTEEMTAADPDFTTHEPSVPVKVNWREEQRLEDIELEIETCTEIKSLMDLYNQMSAEDQEKMRGKFTARKIALAKNIKK